MYGIIFLHYRAGSTLTQYLLGEEKGLLPIKSNKNYIYRHTNCGNLNNVCFELINKGNNNFIITNHIGNWWGNLSSSEIPLPYQDPSPMKFDLKALKQMPNFYSGKYRYFNVLRDGRNTIESLRRLKGGAEEKLNAQDPEDYFKSLCLSFRNKARIALDCQRQSNHYRIIRFEDIIAKPVLTMQSMFKVMDISLDKNVCKKRALDIKERKVGKNHTSFRKDSNMNKRWENWNNFEKDYFKEVAGRELIELGYERNLNW